MSKTKVTKKTVITETTEVINNAKNEKTEIVCILDRSGSMSSIISDAIGGFNTFIKEQKEEDTPATITVALFDDQYELLYDDVDIKEVSELTSKDWSPRGTTALFDAVGKTINTVKARHKSLDKKDRPDKVLVCIVTDGHENASREYNNESIKSLIEKREKKNWSFVFLAADQDAITAGGSFGVKGGNAFNYANTSSGNKNMFAAMSKMSSNVRGASVSSANYADMSKNLAKDLEKDIDK
jgi:uncharacterized protein YegL